MNQKEDNSRFHDYFVNKLYELTSKTQNDFYREVAEELIRLRRAKEENKRLVGELGDQIKGWEKWQREVHYAVDTYGSHKP